MAKAAKSSFSKFNKKVPKDVGYEDTKVMGGKKKPIKKGK